MERRDFLKLGMQKTVELATDAVEARAEERAKQWIRPPYAVKELDFLFQCTRCDACIEACPHDVLFPLPVRLGMDVAATPAMDLLNKGCHLCHDWPCVQACEPNALQLPVETAADEESSERDTVTAQYPRLALAEIDTSACLPYMGPECGACRDSCPVPGALSWMDEKPSINADLCVGCALCREACVVSPPAVLIKNSPPLNPDR